MKGSYLRSKLQSSLEQCKQNGCHACFPSVILKYGLCRLGGGPSEYPNPHADWNGFIKAVQGHLGTQSHVWDPITNRPQPWIHVNRLAPYFGKSSGCVIS
jgi:hypothetical protein